MPRLPKLLLLAPLALVLAAPARAETGPKVRLTTSLGTIDVQLYSDKAPKSVENFLGYANRGDYDGSFFHRSVTNFVLQGGGYAIRDGQQQKIAQQPAVVNEPGISNLRGTIAMAKIADQPNSATDEFFFNESDNSANLDNQNGGFTVFGKILDANGLGVLDKIAALPTTTQSSPFAFDTLPVRDYTSGMAVQPANLVLVSTVRVITDADLPTDTTPTSTTPTTTAPTTTTRPTPTKPPKAPTSGPPIVPDGAFKLTAKALSVPALKASSRQLEVVVAKVPAGTRLTVALQLGGSTVRGATQSRHAGRLTFRVDLDETARGKLRRTTRHSLALTVRATPLLGKASQVRTHVRLRG